MGVIKTMGPGDSIEVVLFREGKHKDATLCIQPNPLPALLIAMDARRADMVPTNEDQEEGPQCLDQELGPNETADYSVSRSESFLLETDEQVSQRNKYLKPYSSQGGEPPSPTPSETEAVAIVQLVHDM